MAIPALKVMAGWVAFPGVADSDQDGVGFEGADVVEEQHELFAAEAHGEIDAAHDGEEQCSEIGDSDHPAAALVMTLRSSGPKRDRAKVLSRNRLRAFAPPRETRPGRESVRIRRCRRRFPRP
jgi:hypothetical protein